MTYLDRAIKDGYAIITGPENKQKIIYVTSDNHTENYNDPEEKVRAEFWAELIYEYDYPAHRIKVEVTIPDRVPTDRADIVIFSDDECKKPYAVVECKRDGVTDAEFLQAIEQGVGNATWVKLRASYVVIIAGATRRVLDFSDDSTGILERENNIIADLPKAYGKPQAFRFYRGGEYTDVDGKKKKAPDIQPVAREDLITAIKKCHNTLWGGGRLSPPTAFGELCKLIFVKISDEQKPRKKGEPYQFQIKTHEPSSKLAERINALYNEQKVKDPEVFTDSIKVDDRVLRTVVSHLESINLNKTDLDVKGVAFEQFMDGFFKGDFGQYFTPRPIIEFAVKMMKPEHDWDVLDPACGSGGFLLHALDYMRSQASEYTIRKPLLLDNKQPLLDNKKSFAYLEDSNLIVFLDCGNEHRIEEEISAIYKAHTEDGLSIVDLEARIPGKGYKAYHVDKECKLSIICFDEHINVDQPRIVLRGREEKRIYTAIDLMYMLMFSSEVSQIAEFDSDEKNSESQVLSWGGASDYFTVFLSEKGFISKGAIEYSNVYSEVDTSAAHIFSHYLELGGVFPFHLSSTIFADPECWNVICDDNSVYQFTRKVKALPGGALFKYDNGCSVFLSYNFFSILKESNITQSRLSLDMFRAVTEKFFIEYHQDLSAIPPLANTLVQFCCHSLSNQNPEHYVCCQKAKVSSNKLVVDFEVNSSKIASDIAEAIDRSVEYSVIGELLQPLVCLSKDSYSELFEKMELTSGQKKTLGTTAVRIDYYFNPDTYEIKETDVSELSIRKQIAKICAAAGVLPGTYERRDATEIVRKIQESVVSHLEQAIRTLERDRLHILLLSALATEQLSVNLNRTGATLTEDIEEGERIKSLEKSTQLSEKAKMRKSALLYLIETNLYLVNERKEEAIDSSKLSELLSFAKWIIYLQNSSDLCFHTDSDTKLIVEDDYRIDVELGENYSQTFEKESQRRIIAEPFNLRGDNTDRDFFEKVANAFYEDLGVHFKVLESVLHHLSDSSFSHDNVEFDEIAPNVIKAKATDVLNDYLSFVVENVPVEDVKSAYDFLTIVPGQLKTICDTTHPILPIWEREKRNHCFAVRPIYMSNNDYIYSPIIMEEVRKRWIEGFLQFYPPFEIGLERTCTALYAWKNNYEHLFSSEVEVLLKESGCEYAKHDVDLRREDRRGNHPTIDVLGDYDMIGLNTTQKRIFIIECKVLQPIGSVFEHSNQQKRFFTKEKFDEKFQKRIDYFSKVAMSFFANHGYDTEGFTINPYMVVNKVFSSYYKHVQFPIVTFDELKREIQL